MSLVHISEDIGDALQAFVDAYNQIQDGEYQQASKTVLSSEIGTDTIVFVILPIIIAIIAIIFSFISCCYMCCCNSAKKYKQKQQMIDKLILDSAKQCNIQYKKGDDVLTTAKQQNLPVDVASQIESEMELIKENEYRKAKRCLVWSQVCAVIFFGFSIVYCVGLGFMQSSVTKLGKIAPEEKTMLDNKIQDILDVTTSYSQLLDQSLAAIGLTNSTLINNLVSQDDEAVFNQTMDKFFDDLLKLKPVQNILDDVQKLYVIDETSRKDLASVIRNLLYYQTYTGAKPDFVNYGQKAIDDTTTNLNYIDSSLTELDGMKTQLSNDMDNVKNIITSVNIDDYDIPTFNDIIKNLNQTVQNIITELKDVTTEKRLARVMLQVKDLIKDSFDQQELLDELIPWTKEGSEIKDTGKGNLLKFLTDILGVNLEDFQEQMKVWLPEADIQQYKDTLYEAYKYIKQARDFQQLTFNEFFAQLRDKTCGNFWCGLIEEEQYNEIMDTLSGIPLLKVDKENPQSVMSSVTLILSIAILVIPIIYIVFVILSLLCNWKCCSCFSIAILPWCSIFAALMLIITILLSVPKATVAPITDLMTSDLDKLTTEVGEVADEFFTQEELNQYLKHNIDVSSLEKYLEFYQDSLKVTTLNLDFSSFNITKSLENFDYQMKPVYSMADNELTSGETVFQNLLEMFPTIKQYTIQVNKLISAFENILVNLNMGKSTVNKLFADEKQSILGLIKFGEQNIQDIINQIVIQGLNYAFDKDSSNTDGIKGFLQVNEAKADSTADSILNEYINIDQIKNEIQQVSLKSTQCVIDDNQDTVTKAYKMTDEPVDRVAEKEVTLFTDVTTLLEQTDDAQLAQKLTETKDNLDGMIDTSDIFNNSIITIENLFSNILLEYLQAQNVKEVTAKNGSTYIIDIPTASQKIKNERGKLNWEGIDLSQPVSIDDTTSLDNFEKFIQMMDDDTVPQGGCFKLNDVLIAVQNDAAFNTFKAAHAQPKWWQNIISQRQIPANEKQKYKLQGYYCAYIQETSKKLKETRDKLNVTTYQDMKQFVYNLNKYIIDLTSDWNSIINKIYEVEVKVFDERYICQGGEGQLDPAYISDGQEHIAKDIDTWAKNIFRSVTHNIAQVFKVSEVNPMPQIVPILIESQLYDDTPQLVKNITNQTLEQVVDEDSLLNTKLLNTGLTTLADQMEIVSDPFNTMSLGIYLCLLFCLTTPFFACCSYKYVYLKNYEHQRKRKLGIADPYKEDCKQSNKRDKRVEVETTQVYTPVVPQQQMPNYPMPQVAIEPNNGNLEYNF